MASDPATIPSACPSCGSTNANRLGASCALDSVDPDPWHREAMRIGALNRGDFDAADRIRADGDGGIDHREAIAREYDALQNPRDRPLADRPAPADPPRAQEIEDAVGILIKSNCPEWEERADHLAATPRRFATAWRDLTSGYSTDPADFLTTFDADGYDELVLETGIPFYSLCEHHLLPFHGRAHLGYIPGDRIVGLSKLDRLVDCYSRRLSVQERLTAQIADALDQHLQPKGVVVVIEAEHLCKSMRGVRKAGTSMVTSAVRGVLRDKPEARAEALTLINGKRANP